MREGEGQRERDAKSFLMICVCSGPSQFVEGGKLSWLDISSLQWLPYDEGNIVCVLVSGSCDIC